MKLVVVNDKDEVLGYKERDDRDQSDIIRVSGIWLTNENGEVLIAQRAFSKFHDPGKWAISAAGTVEEGETYVTNILKEVEEELGLSLSESELIVGPKRYVETDHRYFCQMYFARLKYVEITIQEEEVAAFRWIAIQKLRTWFESKPSEFIESFGPYLDYLGEFSGS